jgi:hypothetical protein
MIHWKTAPFFGDPSMDLYGAMNQAYNHLVFRADWQFEALSNLQGGGYHSVWIQALAEGGVVLLFGLAASYWLLLRDAAAALKVSAAPFLLVMLLLIRSFVEYSALFAKANAPLDLVTIVAIIHVAQFRRAVRPRLGRTARR